MLNKTVQTIAAWHSKPTEIKLVSSAYLRYCQNIGNKYLLLGDGDEQKKTSALTSFYKNKESVEVFEYALLNDYTLRGPTVSFTDMNIFWCRDTFLVRFPVYDDGEHWNLSMSLQSVLGSYYDSFDSKEFASEFKRKFQGEIEQEYLNHIRTVATGPRFNAVQFTTFDAFLALFRLKTPFEYVPGIFPESFVSGIMAIHKKATGAQP